MPFSRHPQRHRETARFPELFRGVARLVSSVKRLKGVEFDSSRLRFLIVSRGDVQFVYKQSRGSLREMEWNIL